MKYNALGKLGASRRHVDKVAWLASVQPPKQKYPEFKPPANWAEWVSTVPIKSGSGISLFHPLDWQLQTAQTIIKNRDRRKSYVFCKSRQVGATTLGLSIVDYLALTVPGFTALFLHKTYNDAALLGYRNRKFLTNAKVPMASDSLSRQEFPNDSVIYFRSSDPESCGRGLDSVDCVVFEECAFYTDLAATIGAIAPAQTWVDNAISLFVSTPNGKRGEGARYWELLSQGDDQGTERKLAAIRNGTEEPYQILRSDSASSVFIAHWRAVERYQKEPDFKGRIIEESGISEETFSQEYDLDFSSSESSAVFPFELVDRASRGLYEEPEENSAYYLGVDPAAAGDDFSVAIVLKKDDDSLSVVRVYRRQKGTSEQHLSAIAGIIREYHPINCTVEKNSIGQLWIEQLFGMGITSRITPFTTTRDSKASLVGRISIALEREDLNIPPKSPIIQELLAFQRLPSGKLEAAPKHHDDCVLALGFAILSSGYGVRKGIFGNIATRSDLDDLVDELGL